MILNKFLKKNYIILKIIKNEDDRIGERRIIKRGR